MSDTANIPAADEAEERGAEAQDAPGTTDAPVIPPPGEDQLRMQSGPKGEELESVAAQLLNGLYHNPEHVDLVAAAEPVMPSRETRWIWEALLEQTEEGSLDGAALRRELRGSDLFGRIEREQVAGLIETTRHGQDPSQLETWAEDLHEAASRERLSEMLVKMGKRARSSDKKTGEIGAHAMRIISGLITETNAAGLIHISEAVEAALAQADAIESGENVNFIKTGFYSLDRVTGGAPVGELTIFASISGMGKTSFALQLIRQMARIERRREEREGKAQRAVILFSIEMTLEQCMWRCAAGEAGHNLQELQRELEATTHLREDNPRRAEVLRQFGEVKDEMRLLSDLPVYLDADPEPTIEEIYTRCLQVQARQRARGCEEGEEIAVIVTDYDEKVDVGAHHSEELRVSAISKGLKTLGKRLNAASVALSQYNSKPEDERRPGRDGDLRYSRKKHQEAHTILHWWWPAYFVRKGDVGEAAALESLKWYDPQHPKRGALLCTKNRNGSVGKIDLDFTAETTSFRDPNEPNARQVEPGRAPVPQNESPF